MDLQDAIEEVKELNARAAALTTDQLLDIHSGGAQRYEEAEIERMAMEAFAKKRQNGNGSANGAADGVKSVPMPDSAASAAADSSAAAMPATGTAALPVLKRLPDAVDLASADFRPAVGGSALDQLEVPDSPTGGDSDGADAAANSAAANSFTAAAAASSAAPITLSSVAPALSAASTAAPPLAGLVLLKKRKDKADDPDKEKKRQKKAAKAEKKAAEAAQSAAGGLGGLLGSYGDDSD